MLQLNLGVIMTEIKSDPNGKKEPGNDSKDKKKKKKFRTLKPPVGIEAVIARRKASE